MKEYHHTSEEDNLILFYNKYLNAGKVGEDYFFKLIENYVDAKVEKVYDIQIPKYEGVYNIEYMTTVEE